MGSTSQSFKAEAVVVKVAEDYEDESGEMVVAVVLKNKRCVLISMLLLAIGQLGLVWAGFGSAGLLVILAMVVAVVGLCGNGCIDSWPYRHIRGMTIATVVVGVLTILINLVFGVFFLIKFNKAEEDFFLWFGLGQVSSVILSLLITVLASYLLCVLPGPVRDELTAEAVSVAPLEARSPTESLLLEKRSTFVALIVLGVLGSGICWVPYFTPTVGFILSVVVGSIGISGLCCGENTFFHIRNLAIATTIFSGLGILGSLVVAGMFLVAYAEVENICGDGSIPFYLNVDREFYFEFGPSSCDKFFKTEIVVSILCVLNALLSLTITILTGRLICRMPMIKSQPNSCC